MSVVEGQGTATVQPYLEGDSWVYPDGLRLKRVQGGEGPSGAPPAAATPEPGQGGGAPQPGPQPTAQPDGFRALYPGIPDELWSQVEPHLRQTQGHVTQMEQLSKPLRDAGATPEDVGKLVNFASAYNADPVGTWLQMAEQLAEQMPELDLQELSAIAYGQPSPYEQGGQQPGAQPQAPDQAALPPEYMQQFEQMSQAVNWLMEERRQEQATSEQRRQDALLQSALTNVRGQLKEAGAPEPDDSIITAALIANRGDTAKVVQQIVGYRGAILEGLANNSNGGGGPAPMPNGAPPTRERPKQSGDGFSKARSGAEQFLRRSNQEAAQGG